MLIQENEGFDHLDVLNMSCSGQIIHEFAMLPAIFIHDYLHNTAVNINRQRYAHRAISYLVIKHSSLVSAVQIK